GAPGDTGWAWHGTPLLSAWVLGAGHGCHLRACSRWPPRQRCSGGGHPRALTAGEQADRDVWVAWMYRLGVTCVPRDYGSFACPGRCPVLPYRMGQGATLDGTRGETRTHTGIPFEGMASTGLSDPSENQPTPPGDG